MIVLDSERLNLAPYPHLICDGMIEAGVFDKLKADFPPEQTFLQHKIQEFGGGRSNRINLTREHPAFHDLLLRSDAWRSFFSYINTAHFVSQVVGLFSSLAAPWGCRVDLSKWKFADFIERTPRTFLQKAAVRSGAKAALDRIAAAASENQFFIAIDIAWAGNGYATEIHTDNRNKLAAMLIYFNETDGEGGDFQIHALKTPRPLDQCVRYPAPDDTRVAETLIPKANRGCVLLNCNNAYHSVVPMRGSSRPRQFLYISINSRHTAPIW